MSGEGNFRWGGGEGGQVSRAIKGERFRVTSPLVSFAISHPSVRIFSAEKGTKNVEVYFKDQPKKKKEKTILSF